LVFNEFVALGLAKTLRAPVVDGLLAVVAMATPMPACNQAAQSLAACPCHSIFTAVSQ